MDVTGFRAVNQPWVSPLNQRRRIENSLRISPTIPNLVNDRFNTEDQASFNPKKSRPLKIRKSREKHPHSPRCHSRTIPESPQGSKTPSIRRPSVSSEGNIFTPTRKASRKQAVRAVKIIRSVEDSDEKVRSPSFGISATPSSTDSTSRPRRRATLDSPIEDEKVDADFSPSKAISINLSFGESPRSPCNGSRRLRSDHQYRAKTNTSRHTLPIIEMASPTLSETTIYTQRRRLDEDSFVELSGVELAYQELLSTIKESNDEIATKQKFLADERRK